MGGRTQRKPQSVLPDGRKLLTLRDAAEYITALPQAEHDAAEWQATAEALLLVVDRGGPVMLAETGIRRALNAGKPDPAVKPRRKPSKRPMLIS